MEEKKSKSNETEEELKARLKEEIMAELLEEIKEEAKEEVKKEMKKEADPLEVQRIIEEERKKEERKKQETLEKGHKKEKIDLEEATPTVKSKVKFESYNDSGIEDINQINRKERVLPHSGSLEKKFELPKSEDEKVGKSTIVILVIALIVITVGIFGGGKIYNFVLNMGRDSNHKPLDTNTNTNSNEQPLETITLNSKILANFTYPIMRNSPYQKATYYAKDKITMSDLANNDILYNAFLNIPEVFYEDYKGRYTAGKYCSDTAHQKTFSAAYISTRINNLYTRDTKYKNATFVVPSTNTKTTYVGTWVYDAKNNRYIYYGNCSGNQTGNVLYYDVISAYEASGTQNNTVIDVNYYVAFAMVNASNKQYTIYSDAAMTNTLTSGTLTSNDYQKELNTLLATYANSNKEAVKKYKYTFSTLNCSYQDYCFTKGEWME